MDPNTDTSVQHLHKLVKTDISFIMLLFLIDLKYIVAIEVLNNYIAVHNDMLSWVIKINTINKYQIKGIKSVIFVELFSYALYT